MALSVASGARTRMITIQRRTVTTDAFGGEVETWADFTAAYASVSFGTGQERRQASQEAGSLTATFRVPDTARTRLVGVQDRIQYQGAAWDISSVVPAADEEFGAAIDLTGTRAT